MSDVACAELIDGDDVILSEPLSVTLTSIDGSATGACFVCVHVCMCVCVHVCMCA